MVFLLLTAGLVLLVFGGEMLVKHAEQIALRLGVSSALIGLTIVGFGTSTPELVTSLQAAFAGSPGISVGNVVGSNIANILFILGLTALISTLSTTSAFLKRDLFVLVSTALISVLIVHSGYLDRWIGMLLVLGLLGYVTLCVINERSRAPVAADASGSAEPAMAGGLWKSGLFFVAGLLMTLAGAKLFVDGAVDLATRFGVSETLIGLTIVAVGTSLPELITSVIAAVKKKADLAFGNIVGSNIFNILFILGITASVQPIPVPPEIARVDIWVMLSATLALAAFALRRKIGRVEGAVLMAGYLGYTGWLIAGI